MADTDLLDYAGLKHYDSKIKSCMWNWQKTKKNALVQFKPVPESDLEPVVDFIFTETPPAEGEKGPDNPSTIAGVSSVKMTRCGKNLLTYPYYSESISDGELTITPTEDGLLNITKTVSTNNRYYIFVNSGLTLTAGSTLAISLTKVSGTDSPGVIYGIGIQLLDAESNLSLGIWYALDNPLTYTLERDINIKVRLFLDRSFTVTNLVIKPQIEIGSIASNYEKGVGSVYTLTLGDTYYGGSLDVATGVMTVTKAYITISSVAASDGIQNDAAVCRFWTDSVVSDGTETCDKLPYARSGSGIDRFFIGTNVNASGQYPIYIILKTSHLDFSGAADPANPTNVEVKSAVNTYLASNPVHVVATRKEPATIQLTPTQIRSLPALDKYEPKINTVYTDQEAVQVGYQRYADISSILARLDAIEAQLNG